MKKQLLTLGILGMLLSFGQNVSAQDYIEKKITNPDGQVNLVVFKANSGLNAASANNLFKDVLKLTSNEELKLIKTEKDFTGKFTDEKYQLFYKNIKVEGGVYNLHYKNGNLVSMNGEIYQDNDIPT